MIAALEMMIAALREEDDASQPQRRRATSKPRRAPAVQPTDDTKPTELEKGRARERLRRLGVL